VHSPLSAHRLQNRVVSAQVASVVVPVVGRTVEAVVVFLVVVLVVVGRAVVVGAGVVKARHELQQYFLMKGISLRLVQSPFAAHLLQDLYLSRQLGSVVPAVVAVVGLVVTSVVGTAVVTGASVVPVFGHWYNLLTSSISIVEKPSL